MFALKQMEKKSLTKSWNNSPPGFIKLKPTTAKHFSSCLLILNIRNLNNGRKSHFGTKKRSLNRLKKKWNIHYLHTYPQFTLQWNIFHKTKPWVPSTLLAMKDDPNSFLPNLLAPDFHFISTFVHMTGVKPAPHSHTWAELRAGPQHLSSFAGIMLVLSKKFHTNVFRLSRWISFTLLWLFTLGTCPPWQYWFSCDRCWAVTRPDSFFRASSEVVL